MYWLSVAWKSLNREQLSNAGEKIHLEKLDVTDASVEKVQIASNNCG